MKSNSFIFTGVQIPLTLFGLPPQLFILNAGGAAMVFGVFVAINLMSIALIMAVIVFAGTWTVLFRKNRQDPHFSSRIFIVPLFWRSRSVRFLVAGVPQLEGKK